MGVLSCKEGLKRKLLYTLGIFKEYSCGVKRCNYVGKQVKRTINNPVSDGTVDSAE
jgi:hypothetical protein